MSSDSSAEPGPKRKTVLVLDNNHWLTRLVAESIVQVRSDVEVVSVSDASLQAIEHVHPNVVVAGTRGPLATTAFYSDVQAACRCPVLVFVPEGSYFGQSTCLRRPPESFLRVRTASQLESTLRRILESDEPRPRVLRAGPLRLEYQERCIRLCGVPLPLSAGEFTALRILLEREGLPVSAEQIASACGADEDAVPLSLVIERLRDTLSGSPVRIFDRGGAEFLLSAGGDDHFGGDSST